MRFTDVTDAAPDLQARAAGRMLWQFRRSPVLLSILHALVKEIQVLTEACVEVRLMRTPYRARGANLEAIGRIVGQDRILIDYSEIEWFTPDRSNLGADQALVWCAGAPLYTNGVANDTLYRILIQAKVYRNFCRYGSVPEIQTDVLEAFDVNVSFQRASSYPLEVTLLVPPDVPLYVLGFLTKCSNTVRADSEYLPPYPATVRIVNVMFLLDPAFATDVEGSGADQGYASVTFAFG